MNRRRPDQTVASALDPVPPVDRSHWERIAEEALTRAFQSASAGLPLPGIDGRGPEAITSSEVSAGQSPSTADSAPRRLGFRLSLSGSGTSFTPIIGAYFHFESLRKLTAASGRQLGLRGVIVVKGQVVLLPESTNPSIQKPGPTAPWTRSQQGGSIRSWAGLATASTRFSRSLLGQAALVPQPIETDLTPRLIGPAPRPLWAS